MFTSGVNQRQVLSIYDLNPRESLSALRRLRQKMKGHVEEDHILEQALQDIGGRLSYMARAGRSNDILEAAKNMRENEKAWLLSRIGLIPDCDDDVMDEQKVCASSWLLLQEFVKRYKAQEEEYLRLKEAGESPPELTTPTISYYEARQIMTRPDFLEFLDTVNIVAIDAHHVVRPDSTLMLRAAREVVEEEGFEELLTNVRERIDEIEGLHRTRELIWKTSEEGDTLKIVVEDGKKQSRIY
ncbi:hypothetical protein FRC03_012308 [Tulasnella sp. 419]|nr:hypothetical protein FRC03_012308 [Tulasnella sp. 419]